MKRCLNKLIVWCGKMGEDLYAQALADIPVAHPPQKQGGPTSSDTSDIELGGAPGAPDTPIASPWAGNMQTTTLVLVPKGSPNAIVFEHATTIAAGSPAPLTLASHPGRTVMPKHFQPKNFMGWMYFDLGVGGDATQLPAYQQAFCTAAFDAARGFVVRGTGETDDKKKFTLHVSLNKFEENNKVDWVMGQKNGLGGRSFVVNAEGTIGPVKATHLVLGIADTTAASPVVTPPQPVTNAGTAAPAPVAPLQQAEVTENYSAEEPADVWKGDVQMTTLALVAKGSPNAIVFEHATTIAAGSPAPLTLASHPGRTVMPKHFQPKNFMGWMYFDLGVGGDATQLPAYQQAFCTAAFDAARGFVVRGTGETDDKKKFTLHVSLNKFEENNKVDWVMGQKNDFGGRSFVVNAEGTIGPAKATHLVLGIVDIAECYRHCQQPVVTKNTPVEKPAVAWAGSVQMTALVLVPKGEPTALVFENAATIASGISTPLTLASHPGRTIVPKHFEPKVRYVC